MEQPVVKRTIHMTKERDPLTNDLNLRLTVRAGFGEKQAVVFPELPEWEPVREGDRIPVALTVTQEMEEDGIVQAILRGIVQFAADEYGIRAPEEAVIE